MCWMIEVFLGVILEDVVLLDFVFFLLVFDVFLMVFDEFDFSGEIVPGSLLLLDFVLFLLVFDEFDFPGEIVVGGPVLLDAVFFLLFCSFFFIVFVEFDGFLGGVVMGELVLFDFG